MPTPSCPHMPPSAAPVRRGLWSVPDRWRLWRGIGGQCEVCRAWSSKPVCSDCRSRFSAPMARCVRCAIDLPASAEGRCCGTCLRQPPPQSLTLAGLPYAYPWDGLVQRFKRHGAVELARVLVEPLVDAVQQPDASGADAWPHLLVPVPLSRRRLIERGYDQALILARLLGQQLNVPVDGALVERIIDTPHQLALPREERLANVRGAFAVAPDARSRLQGRCVAVIDDVMTTGATVAEVAATLRRAGVADVQVWVAARTPLD